MLDQWMREGKGFLLVYTITSQATFDEAANLYEKILRAKDKDKVPMVLCGNKCDLESSRQVPTAAGKKLAEKWGYVPLFHRGVSHLCLDYCCLLASLPLLQMSLFREQRQRQN
jgi:GTPase SAR1 family protein